MLCTSMSWWQCYLARSLTCKGVTAWRYWCENVPQSTERSVRANRSLTTACGHSCKHSSKGHAGLTMHPIKLHHWTLCPWIDMWCDVVLFFKICVVIFHAHWIPMSFFKTYTSKTVYICCQCDFLAHSVVCWFFAVFSQQQTKPEYYHFSSAGAMGF